MGQYTDRLPHHAREQAHREAHCIQRAGCQGRSPGMHKFMQSSSRDINIDEKNPNCYQVRRNRRRLSSSLDPRESYLLVGGLRGVCGSLALHMAKTGGARHLAVMCRSGYDDDRSQEVIRNLEALDCSVDTLIGDVAVLEDVRRCFAEMTVPVAGIIQGAMVLRVRCCPSLRHCAFSPTLHEIVNEAVKTDRILGPHIRLHDPRRLP